MSPPVLRPGDVVKVYSAPGIRGGHFSGIGIYLGLGHRGTKTGMPELLWNARIATFDPIWWRFEVQCLEDV